MPKKVNAKEMNVVKQLLLSENYDKAINELRKLKNKYPNDYDVLFQLGSVLLRQGQKVSEALYLLNLATNKQNKRAVVNEIGTYYFNQFDFDKAEDYYTKLLDGSEKERSRGLHQLIKIYIHEYRFEEAYELFKELKKVSLYADYDITHFNNLEFYLTYTTGGNILYIEGDAYFQHQLLDYSRERAVEHIAKHLMETNPDGTRIKTFHSVFDENIDISELYDYISEEIEDMDPTGIDVVDYYKLKFDDYIGKTYNGKRTKYVEAVVIPNTKQILSIYPVNQNHIDRTVKIQVEENKKGNKKIYKKRTK